MPQMKPMNWIYLFIMINFIIIFMNIMNYHMKSDKKLNNNNMMTTKKLNNWKW